MRTLVIIGALCASCALASQEYAFTARGTITDTDFQSISNITQACRESCISFGSSLSACGYNGDDGDDDDDDFDFDFDQDNIDPACACTRTNLANLVTCRDCLVDFPLLANDARNFTRSFIKECARYGYNSSETTTTTGTATHTGSATETGSATDTSGSVTDSGSATANTETGTPTETSPASTATSTSTSTSDATKITGIAAGVGYGVVAMVLTAVSLAVL